MLAYNVLFFYPFLIFATIISIVLIAISAHRFKTDKVKYLLILISTLPTLYLLTIVIINISQINYEMPAEETEKLKFSKIVKINDELTLTFNGYEYKNIRKKIEFIPDKKKYTSKQFSQGKYSTYFLFYKVEKDSLYIFIPEEEVLYFTNDGYEKLPIKVNHFKGNKIDLKQNKELIMFNWQ